jgi:TolB-like protein/DNA-binding winged helix-turn-helix (wHTH) protein
MATSDPPPCASIIRFGSFEVDVRSGELRKNGLRIRLQEQPFQVLVALLMRPGEVISREELRDLIWPKGTYVCFDYALNTAIKKIRVALSDDASVPRYIETIPRRGYRFIGNISPVSSVVVEHAGAGVLSSTRHDRSRTSRYRLLTAVAVALALLAAAVLYFGRRMTQLPAAEKRTMVVVLPFENLDRDANQEALCVGLTEEIITQLGRVDPRGLAVAARSSVLAYEGRHESAAEIGRALRADYVLEGSVRHAERQVRVSAQLIRTADQSHVWANEFDGELDDSLAFQSEVAATITREVQQTLLPSGAPRSR